MAIQVKFFASLRDRLGLDDLEITAGQVGNVGEVWRQVTGQESLPTNILCSLNLEYVKADAQVSDGDEVAFFPPVTGG